MTLLLLAALEENGPMRCRDVAEAIAERVSLDAHGIERLRKAQRESPGA